MTQKERPWLPPTAFTLDALRRTLSPVLRDWASTWFVNGTAELASIRHCADPARSASARQCLRHEGSPIVVDLPQRAKRKLLEAALEVDLADVVLAEADHRLLDGFAQAMVDDLLVRFGTDSATPDADARWLCLSMTLDGRELLGLHCPEELLVEPIRAASGRTSIPEGSLHPRWDAVGGAGVVAEGVLGRASLTMAELDGLAVGDVIVLDRTATDAVDLVLVESRRTVAHGILGSDQDRRALLI